MALAERDVMAALMADVDPPDVLDFFRQLRPRWMAKAVCHGRTAAFFRETAEPTAEARELCGGCPVGEPCLAYALADPALEGTWAGTSKRERRAMRRKAS